MSYTMTMDMPSRAAAYVGRSPRLRRELNAIVVAVVTMRMQSASARAGRSSKSADGRLALSKWDRLVKAGRGRLAKPYRFSRADAYDEELEDMSDGQAYDGVIVRNPFAKSARSA